MSKRDSHQDIVEQCLDFSTPDIVAIDEVILQDERLLRALRYHRCFVADLDRREPIRSEQELMDRLGKTCGFGCFSRNWNALLDLLCDWTWMPPHPSYVLLLHHPGVMPEETRKTFYAVIYDAASAMRTYDPQALKLLIAKTADPRVEAEEA